MEILGVGPLEFIFIVLIALIVVGPNGMINLARKTADLLRRLRKSDIWATTREVMDMPNQIMKETGLDKELREIKSLTTPPTPGEIWQQTLSVHPAADETETSGKEKSEADQPDQAKSDTSPGGKTE